MGRTTRSQGLAPPAIRKDARAKQARHVVNKVIPMILASNARARTGSPSSELIVDPQVKNAVTPDPSTLQAVYVKRKGQGRRKKKAAQGDEPIEAEPSENVAGKRVQIPPVAVQDCTAHPNNSNPLPSLPRPIRKLQIIATDTLTAAARIQHLRGSKNASNVCVLNMASPLRPGGGLLTGATSQEEFLCARTTLLPSLKEEYYRLPEFGGIWTPNVQVFRSARPLGDPKGELGPTERYWVDVISAGMLRFPELEEDDEGTKKLCRKDREIVESKMRAVLRIAFQKKVKQLVLGAWGCGAYGNPISDIAGAWKKVLDASLQSENKEEKQSDVEKFSPLEEVVFAIGNSRMAREFAQAFDAGIVVQSSETNDLCCEDEDGGGMDTKQELRIKIEEIEGQIDRVWNPDLRSRLTVVLRGLRTQLRDGEEPCSSDSDGGV